MTKQELVERMQQGQAWVPGKRVKIDFGGSEGAVMLDGAAQQVSEEDGAADTTIKVGWDDWQQLAAGQLDGMTAFMMGKLKVEGDMSQRDAAAGRAGEAEGLKRSARFASASASNARLHAAIDCCAQAMRTTSRAPQRRDEHAVAVRDFRLPHSRSSAGECRARRAAVQAPRRRLQPARSPEYHQLDFWAGALGRLRSSGDDASLISLIERGLRLRHPRLNWMPLGKAGGGSPEHLRSAETASGAVLNRLRRHRAPVFTGRLERLGDGRSTRRMARTAGAHELRQERADRRRSRQFGEQSSRPMRDELRAPSSATFDATGLVDFASRRPRSLDHAPPPFPMGGACRKSIPNAEAALDGLLFDGMTIAAGGFGLCGIPERLIDAIVRRAASRT